MKESASPWPKKGSFMTCCCLNCCLSIYLRHAKDHMEEYPLYAISKTDQKYGQRCCQAGKNQTQDGSAPDRETGSSIRGRNSRIRNESGERAQINHNSAYSTRTQVGRACQYSAR